MRVMKRTADLRFSEERYARAMGASNDGLWEWNPMTDELFVSPRAKHLFGVADEIEIRTRTDLKAHGGFHPEDRQRIGDAFKACLAAGYGGFDVEYRVINPGGNVTWVRSRGKVFAGSLGQPTLLTGSLTDITEQKFANDALRSSEAALRLSEKRYALAMEASGEGHWDWSVAADEFYADPQMLALYGFPPGTTFAGRSDFLARLPLHPEDRPKWEAAAASHFAGTTTRLDREIRILRHGEKGWLHLTGLISRDATGEPTRWTGSVADVTDRRAAEDALRLSEHRYALAMEATGDGHWDWNIRADKMYVSALLLEMCGLPPDMTFANRAEWVSRFPFFPGERPRYAQAVAEHFAGKTTRLDEEIRIVPRGETRRGHMTRRCPRDPRGPQTRGAGPVPHTPAPRRVEEEHRARQ